MKRFAACTLAAILLAGAFWLIWARNAQRSAPPYASSSNPTQAVSTVGPAPGATMPGGPQAETLTTGKPPTASRQPVATAFPQNDTPRKRPWDPQFLAGLQAAGEGDPIRFELVDGQWASGTIRSLERRGGELIRVSGQLTAPEAGRFFFQKQTLPGVAGDFVGVVEFGGSKKAYRIEPTGPGGTPELVEHPLGEVVCLNLPTPAASPTNQIEETPPLKPDNYPSAPIPDYQNGIIVLESLPGSTPVIYLDFQGGYTPTWGGIGYDRPSVSNPQIRDVWERVAEDFMPFNLNVTTDLQVYQRAPENSRQRVIITPTTTAAPGAGGVSFVGSFNWTGDTPCWVFITSGKACAEACSHECGHSLGLSHDGQDGAGIAHNEYYGGQGSGDTGWAPIMGVGYYLNVTQWSNGEYVNANNQQDDLAIISGQNNNVTYRADDTGDTLATARYLEVFSNFTARAEGVIERTADTDAFQFSTSGGPISLRVDPVGVGPNLALQATLYDATDTLIASNNSQNVLYAFINTNVPAGAYTFRVTGAGRNDPLTSGFSAYASLGYYAVTGTVANARLPDRFNLPENTPNAALVGVVSANNLGGDPLTYTITSGNTGNTFAIDDTGMLTVLNNTLLDYETLARNTQLPVQFELFVDIENTVNSALTETKRRVVVAITNVNEPPSLPALSSSVLEHTQPGTAVGTVTGLDPDFYTLLSYAIVGGNSNSMFAIGNRSGTITVAGDLDAAAQGVYNLAVMASDQTPPNPLTVTSIVRVTVLPNGSPFRPGSISYALYTNLSGNLISGLTNASIYPYDPSMEKQLTLFEGDSNRGNNYGAVMRGYLIPPATGAYTFWIASDDNGELWLSLSTNSATASRIAYISGDGSYAGPREWTKYASQHSAAISLAAGQAYYIEARLKQGTGGDNIAVAWQNTAAGIARDVIPGRFLAPYFLNYVPHAVGFTYNLHRDALLNSRLGTVTFSDVNTDDDHTFIIAANNLFTIDATTGVIRLTNEVNLQTTTKTNYSLQVKVTDSGSPPRSATATLTVNIVATNAIIPTSLQEEVWSNIGSGTTLNSLTSQPAYPKRPDTLLRLSNFGSVTNLGDNYGSRIRAYLTPTASGNYTFYLASDDNSQLKYSSTTNPATATPIASVADYTGYLEWNKYASQKSASVSLTAGQHYYLETLHKEGGGLDHVEVAWTGPGLSGTNIIASSFLTPVDLNYPPDFLNTTVQVPITASNGFILTNLPAIDSPLDRLTYRILSGNASNTFAINPDTGALSVADNGIIANYFVSSFSLVVQVQDSGLGGLYPLKTAQATVTVQVADTVSPILWTGGGADANWSALSNWNGSLPSENSKLRFLGASQQTNFNDLLTRVGLVAMNNGGFYIYGNPLVLLAGLNNTGDNTWAIDSTLNKPQTFSSGSGTLSLIGSLNNNGHLLTVRVNSNVVRVDGSLSGSGGLAKAGAGTLLITSANSYTGVTTIAAGTLVLAGPGSIGSSAVIDVQSGTVLQVADVTGGFTVTPGQTLKGNGAVIGDATIYGLISPGASPGSLTFSNSLILAGSTLLELNKIGATQANDSLWVGGQLTCGGSLTVTNIGAPLMLGDNFQLLYASSFNGSFASLSLPSLNPGLVWDTSQLTSGGMIRVVPLASPLIAPVVLIGSNLILQLQSVVNLTYVLESSPSLAPMVWTSVSTNSGTGGLITIPIAMDPLQPGGFFRLKVY